MKQLEAALVVCQEELKVHIEQLENTKSKHEQELKARENKVTCCRFLRLRLSHLKTLGRGGSGRFFRRHSIEFVIN